MRLTCLYIKLEHIKFLREFNFTFKMSKFDIPDNQEDLFELGTQPDVPPPTPISLSIDQAQEIAKQIISFMKEAERLRQLLPEPLKKVTTENLQKAAFETFLSQPVSKDDLESLQLPPSAFPSPPKLVRQNATVFNIHKRKTLTVPNPYHDSTQVTSGVWAKVAADWKELATVKDIQKKVKRTKHNYQTCHKPTCDACLDPEQSDWMKSVLSGVIEN